MELSGEVLIDGEPPFDLDMDLGGGDEDESMMSALIMAGATFDQARTYAAAVRGKIDPPTFTELYERGSIVKEASRARRCLNVKGLHALDLTTFRPDGNPCDFTNLQHRRDAK